MNDHILIDGTGVPRDFYRAIKDNAKRIGRTLFIGVHYDPPPRPTGWEHIDFNMRSSAQDLAVGRYCTFTATADRREALEHGHCLWITPID